MRDRHINQSPTYNTPNRTSTTSPTPANLRAQGLLIVLPPGAKQTQFQQLAPPSPQYPAPRRDAPIALPPLKLAGIAEDDGTEGPVRIAFISGGGQLFMVKEGDHVTQRYSVTKISADVVELTDAIDNSTRRLALR